MEKLINVNELSLNFNLRQPRGNKCTNVYAVVKCGSVQIKFPIGCKVNSWQWNKKQQTPIINNKMVSEDMENNIKVMSVISSIKFAYLKYYTYLCNQSQTIKESEVKESINKILKQTDITDMANIENLKKGKTIKATTLLKKAFDIYYSELVPNAKESTKEMQWGLVNAFYKYCEEIGKDGKSMLSQKGLNDYKDYLIKKQKEKEKEGKEWYASNAQINRKCQIIESLINKVMVKYNNFKGVERVEYVKLQEFKAKNADKKRRPLKKEEIDKLINFENLTDEEKEYRDLFLLECNCGYRISDTHKLFNRAYQQHFEKDGNKLIMIKTKKEDIDALILVTPIVEGILSKYESGFKFADPTSEKYTDVFNKRIKSIAKKCGLDSIEKYRDAHNKEHQEPLYKIIGSHFGRYTFIYHSLFDLGFTADELKRFTGHADDKMINEVYAIYSNNDYANEGFKAIERITKANTIKEDKKDGESEKIKEYKDVLAFYGEPYYNYREIDNSEDLFRLIVTKYELPLEQKGYERKLLKEIYNSTDSESRKKYERLLETLKEISDTIKK